MFVPGRQKPRRASLIPAGTRTLPRFGFPAPACIHSATLTKLYRRAVRFKVGGESSESKIQQIDQYEDQTNINTHIWN